MKVFPKFEFSFVFNKIFIFNLLGGDFRYRFHGSGEVGGSQERVGETSGRKGTQGCMYPYFSQQTGKLKYLINLKYKSSFGKITFSNLFFFTQPLISKNVRWSFVLSPNRIGNASKRDETFTCTFWPLPDAAAKKR